MLRTPVNPHVDGEDHTNVGDVSSSFYSGFDPEVGARFDKGFKKHYPNSEINTTPTRTDPKNVDNEARQFRIHRKDMGSGYAAH
jgi:hypothetical protein